jgi:hypothetical protein
MIAYNNLSLLGQNNTIKVGKINFTLISMLQTPLRILAENTYVLFTSQEGATINDNLIDSYYWIVEKQSPNLSWVLIHSKTTSIGEFDYAFTENGIYKISVSFNFQETTRSLFIYQEAQSWNKMLENINSDLGTSLADYTIEIDPGILANINRHLIGGNLTTFTELIADYYSFIIQASHCTGSNGISPKILAATLYNEMISRPKNKIIINGQLFTRNMELEAAIDDINEREDYKWSKIYVSNQTNNSLGIGQLKPSTVCMLLDIISWQELPRDIEQRAKVIKKIESEYEKLDINIKSDIINLLRFPKSNIFLCAQYLTRLKNRENRKPELTIEEFEKDENAIKIIASEYNLGAISSDMKNAKPNKNGPKIYRFIQSPFINPFFKVSKINNSYPAYSDYSKFCEQYGKENLLRGSTGTSVENLTNDLSILGFTIAVENKDKDKYKIFDRQTEWAVREFQIYAKMEYIAKQRNSDKSKYKKILNICPYGGPISGVVDDETKRIIRIWILNEWRCPVIINAWEMENDKRKLSNDSPIKNIWMWDIVDKGRYRMYVQDFTNHYEDFDIRREDNEQGFNDGHIILGTYLSYGQFGGGVSLGKRHTWPESEITSWNLIPDFQEDNASQISTFKVIRSVSEMECSGFFDSVNSYDGAFASLGPCHWTLGIRRNGSVLPGELCGYLSYLKEKDPDGFQKIFGYAGININKNWGLNGSNLFNNSQVKYTALIRCLDKDYLWDTSDSSPKIEDYEYFQTWHWFYRWVMAGRTNQNFRYYMWDMARIRIRDILSTPWGNSSDKTQNVPDNAPPVTTNYKIGDIFTSELAVALLLRWHVNKPAQVISNGKASGQLRQIYLWSKTNYIDNNSFDSVRDINSWDDNYLNWSKNYWGTPSDWGDPSIWGLPELWDDEKELKLIQGIMHYCRCNPDDDKNTVRNSMLKIYKCFNYPGRDSYDFQTFRNGEQLNMNRNSFNFDTKGLTPSPL